MPKCDLCGQDTIEDGTCSDCCNKAVDIGLGVMRDRKAGFFPITSTCKDDIIQAFEGSDRLGEVKKRLETIDDMDMKYLARKLADDYCEQLYWESLKSIFEGRFMEGQM